MKVLLFIGKFLLMLSIPFFCMYFGFIFGQLYNAQESVKQVKKPVIIHMQVQVDSSDSIIPIVTLDKP